MGFARMTDILNIEDLNSGQGVQKESFLSTHTIGLLATARMRVQRPLSQRLVEIRSLE